MDRRYVLFSFVCTDLNQALQKCYCKSNYEFLLQKDEFIPLTEVLGKEYFDSLVVIDQS